MTPMIEALFVVGIACGIVAAWGFYWGKREREEWRARHPRGPARSRAR